VSLWTGLDVQTGGHGWWTVSSEEHDINSLRQFEYQNVFGLCILYCKSILAVFLLSLLLPLFPPNQVSILWRRLTLWRRWRLRRIYDLVLTRNTCWDNFFFCTESARKFGLPHCVKDISCIFSCKLTWKAVRLLSVRLASGYNFPWVGYRPRAG